MAIDTSMYQNMKSLDIAGALERGRKMSELATQREQAQATKDAYKSGIITNPDGTTTIDRAKTMSALAKVNPEKAMEFERQSMADKQAKIASQFQEAGHIAQLTSGVNDQASWDAALGQAKKLGLDVGQAPPQYDPKFVESIRGRALTIQDQLKQQNQEKEFGYKDREIKVKESENQIKKAGNAGQLATGLRTERSGLPTTKATQEVSVAYNRMQSAAKTPSAAGDMAMIFNYMKMLDPGSTVREGEYLTAQQAAGLPDRVVNAYHAAIKGTRLGPEQRADFMHHAGGLYQSQRDVQKKIDVQYSNLARRGGADPNDVLLDFSANDPNAPERLQGSNAPPKEPQHPGYQFGADKAKAAPYFRDMGMDDLAAQYQQMQKAKAQRGGG